MKKKHVHTRIKTCILVHAYIDTYVCICFSVRIVYIAYMSLHLNLSFFTDPGLAARAWIHGKTDHGQFTAAQAEAVHQETAHHEEAQQQPARMPATSRRPGI